MCIVYLPWPMQLKSMLLYFHLQRLQTSWRPGKPADLLPCNGLLQAAHPQQLPAGHPEPASAPGAALLRSVTHTPERQPQQKLDGPATSFHEL